MEPTNVKPFTIADLSKGERGVITAIDAQRVPLKLIELGCFIGSEVQILQKAAFGDHIYMNMNNSYLSIRKDMAQMIEVEKLDNSN